MTITKEQFEIFKKHFEIIETTKILLTMISMMIVCSTLIGNIKSYDQFHLMDIPLLIKKLVENLSTYIT